MLVPMLDVVPTSGALPAFTCYNIESAEGVIAAAEGEGAAAAILLSSSAFHGSAGERFLLALAAVARHSSASIAIQLDHCSELDQLSAAVELGATAVMADGSRLSDEDNEELVRTAVSATQGVCVEAELGRVEGSEDQDQRASAGRLTAPDLAAEFVHRSGAGMLAVSIGNVHGTYASPPQLDWRRLAQIRDRVDVPLALHGASGLSSQDLARAIRDGIRKVNINTELREAYLAVTRALCREDVGSNVHRLNVAQTMAVEAKARDWIRACSP